MVAPFAGAWIEISSDFVARHSNASLPSRERGLKLNDKRNADAVSLSLPSRERGLKCIDFAVSLVWEHVAPFAGAWIEMFSAGNRLPHC